MNVLVLCYVFFWGQVLCYVWFNYIYPQKNYRLALGAIYVYVYCFLRLNQTHTWSFSIMVKNGFRTQEM